jgi:hypothetical protein
MKGVNINAYNIFFGIFILLAFLNIFGDAFRVLSGFIVANQQIETINANFDLVSNKHSLIKYCKDLFWDDRVFIFRYAITIAGLILLFFRDFSLKNPEISEQN